MGRTTLGMRVTSWRAPAGEAGAWQVYLVAGLVATLAFFLLPPAGLAQGLLFVAVHLSMLGA
ncbi:MAG: hypothetical protein KY434_09790, partial [Actinobacteria bacterium]|nr:hypothetical protein [Actinomycetota bacterium]